MNETDLVGELRQKIEARYEESLRALDVLQNYLSECEVPAPRHIAAEPLDPTKYGRNGSYRQLVLSVLDEKWTDVGTIANRSGLTTKRVRGVVYATSVAEKIESKREHGRVLFRSKQ